MRFKHLIAAFGAGGIALAAMPAAAYEPQANKVAKAEQPDKKICRWLPVTGSNINQRVCLTAEDWKKAEALSW